MINLIFIFSLSYFLNKYIVKNYRTGMDDRIYFYPYKKDNITSICNILKIKENTEKIKFLELNNISIDDKLFEIDKNVPKIFCIHNGGLLNDWNFEMDPE
jgi:hypothetical protein